MFVPRRERPRTPAALFVALALATALAAPARSAPAVPTRFQDELVVTGLNLPTAGAFLPDGRFIIAEQTTGTLHLVVHDILSTMDPMGTVPSVRSSAEGGLIGVTFDDRWPIKPYVYVMVTRDSTPTECLWRFKVTGDLAFAADGALVIDPRSRYTVLQVPDLQPSHNGGQLRWGPDSLLYVGIGDDDDPCQAQDLRSPHGKVLRIDPRALPDGPGGPPRYSAITPAGNPFAANADTTARLVWEYGLRNPFTFQIDRPTGCLYIGDVGNNAFEEVDRAPVGGMNFGWPFWEGPLRTPLGCTTVSDSSVMTPPILSYPHPVPGYAINMGPLYRTPANPLTGFPASYDGTLFYADTWHGFVGHGAGAGQAWALADSAPGQPDAHDWATGLQWPTSMNEAPDGTLWYTVYFRDTPVEGPGEVHRIAYYAPSVDVAPGPFDGAMASVRLAPPRPSPSRGAVDFAWTLPRAARVDLAVWNAAGRCVRRLVRASDPGGALAPAGPGAAHWDGTDAAGRRVPPGVYFVRLSAGPATRTARVTLLP